MQRDQNEQRHPQSAEFLPIVGKVDEAKYPFTSVPFTSAGTPIIVGAGRVPYSDTLISSIAVNVKQEQSLLAGYILRQLGNQLATMLARVLDELDKNNQEALGPIVSILEPYMGEVNQNFKVNIRPKSSREVNIEITKLGRAKPRIQLD